MRQHNNIVLFFIAVLTLAAIYVVWPQRPANYLFGLDLPGSPGIRVPLGNGEFFERVGQRLGLDLQGGANLLIQADLSGVPAGQRAAAMDGLKTIIERRVNAFGISEPQIQLNGDERISVQLAGVTNIAEARNLIGSTATLEFRELLEENGVQVRDARGQPTWVPATARGTDGELKPLTGQFLKPNAAVVTGQSGLPEVAFEFNEEGAQLFSQITQRLIGKPLGIFLDGQIISAPTIQSVIGARGVINNIGLQDGQRLVIQLNSGALPVPVTIVKQQEVDATLGSDSIQASIVAGQIGFLLVVLFMVLRYRLPGVVASGALIIYALLTLSIFKMVPITLTLSGIAGFILSLGMAVDANVLIFERTREELRWGKSLSAAVEAGFDRAWSSIRDSNISTLITCVILFEYGSLTATSVVSGFALTLAIGVLVSMFTAIIVTRSFMRGIVRFGWARSLWLYGAQRAPEAAAAPERRPGWLDFVGKRYLYFAISLAVIVPGLISMAIPPAFVPGIEFSSGSSLDVRFATPVEQGAVRETLSDLGFGDAIVQRVGDGQEYLIRTRPLEAPPRDAAGQVSGLGQQEQVLAALSAIPGSGGATIESADTVSALIAGETIRNSALAVLVAAIGILLYVWWAFRQVPKPIRYATCAIIALVHDSLLVLGLFSIFGKVFGTEIDALFITAVLTVIGFSVHDTIVVFDRIRENLKSRSVYDLGEAVNESILQTLGRSLSNTLTVVFTLMALLIFGGATIQTFVLALLIGILSGTYSSIFNASQLLVVWERGEIPAFFRRFFPKSEGTTPPPKPKSRRAASA